IGGVIRQQDRTLENHSRRFNYVGPDGIQNSADDHLGQFLDTTPKWSDSNEGYRQPPWANPFAVARHAALYPNLWREDLPFATTSKLTGDRTITETVTAGYVMAHTRISALSILTGVRVEKTDTDAEGPVTVGTTIGRLRRKGDYT